MQEDFLSSSSRFRNWAVLITILIVFFPKKDFAVILFHNYESGTCLIIRLYAVIYACMDIRLGRFEFWWKNSWKTSWTFVPVCLAGGSCSKTLAFIIGSVSQKGNFSVCNFPLCNVSCFAHSIYLHASQHNRAILTSMFAHKGTGISLIFVNTSLTILPQVAWLYTMFLSLVIYHFKLYILQHNGEVFTLGNIWTGNHNLSRLVLLHLQL